MIVDPILHRRGDVELRFGIRVLFLVQRNRPDTKAVGAGTGIHENRYQYYGKKYEKVFFHFLKLLAKSE